MRELTVNGQKKLCFIVAEGDVNIVYIPLTALSPIDYKRLTEMDKKGGELMAVMRETVLDNGRNALVQYQNLLRTVRKQQPKAKKVLVEDKKTEVAEDDKPAEPVARGRGRPRKTE